ncbi:hypothetical protein TTHERM_000629740 (macronuclear) [Tetrahymena thermophila SB210]|uniref:EGF-like domain-containing protein n=1 Tax=Tetrahymena thermophila (strain SB210) TaxID=312017 RepID=W7XHJ9_TETTS|nr:hypothetical protein TTHERM_000629740 [Tetrahymena thermophila SB210]EWS72584.1 hypothetical protein TTHERM_000629740 [Tetrahymena thermophila SB210]|eukprot:XP_012654867.1 hypothetical protein TTHERM_000629740 [Tetrahymena thermophila SB210]
MMDFTPGFDSKTLFLNQWSIVSGEYDSTQYKADYSCKTSTSTTAGVLSPYYGIYPQQFQVTASAQEQPYQFTYADILYFTTASDLIDFNMVDQPNNVAKKLLGSMGDKQNQQCAYQISCSKNATLNDVVKFSLSYNNQFISKNPVTSFTYHRNPINEDWFGLLKIVIWSNCVENCLTCEDANNCKVCMKGFNRYTLLNGDKVCEETSGCKITNCFSCIKNSVLSINKCVKCNPGYSLDPNGHCYAQSNCSSSQYYSRGIKVCVDYQSFCLMQVSGQYNQWQTCTQPVSTSIIKCPKEKTILIYELKNYQVLTCDCKVDYCDVCLNPQTCDLCKSGYQFNSQKTLCIFNQCPKGLIKDPNSGLCVSNCPGTFCLTCNSSNCLECLTDGNYYIDFKNPQNCLVCTIPNCYNCSNDGKCLFCVPGYALSTDKLSCTCNVQNCIFCQHNSSTLCGQCAPNYYKSEDSTKCSCYIDGCTKCHQNDGSKCLTCASNYIQKNDLCQCQVNNCKICHQKDGLQCLVCNEGLTQNPSNNICYCPIKNCISCSNYTGSDGLNCICNHPNCQICDPNDGSICHQCNLGYTVDSDTKQCKSTLKNCLKNQLGSTNQCQICQNNYLLDSSQQCQCQVDNCQICSPNDGKFCDVCKSGYYKILNIQCLISLLNCLTLNASDITKCQVCQKNYQLDTSFQCQCQAQNCKSCSSSDGNICLQCSQGYVLDIITNECKSTIQHCLQNNPSNLSQCQSCQLNYKLDNSYQCQCQVQNCSICSPNDGNICNKCTNNYQKSSNNQNCSCISLNCQICDLLDGQLCQKCNSGYILDPTTKKCFKQIQNCQTYYPLNYSNCQQCINNFTLDSTTKQCLCSVQNCQICSPNDGKICNKCTNNYLLSSNNQDCSCISLNCQICDQLDGQLCQKCNSGYILDPTTKKCFKQIQNCQTYNPLDYLNCQQCINNFILDQTTNQCLCSVQNCQICSANGQICKTCIKNYMGPQCLCQVQNCSICSKQDGNICDTCNQGFQWNNLTKKCDAIPKCLVQNCDQCQLNNSNSCSQCSDGYLIIINSQKNTNPINICQKINACMVHGCQTCSQTDNNVCLKWKLCQSIDSNYFYVIYKVTDTGYNITISFQENLVNFNMTNYEQILRIEITGIQNYTYQVTSVLSNKIYLSIKVDQNCKNQKLEVKLHDPNFVQINNIQNSFKEVQLSSYVIQNQNQQEQAQAAKSASQSMQSTLLYSMLSIAMIGNFYVLFNTIDLTTFIYFLMFVNVRYPSNVTAFCSIFQNFQMAFIPNVFQAYLIDPDYIQPYTPGKFMDYGNDAYLLNSSGQSYTIVFGILAIYIFIKLLSFIKIPGFQLYLQKKIESGWEYNAFFDLIWSVYMYIVVGVFLQFYKFEFTESLSFLNYTLFSMSFIAIFFIPIMIAIFISKTPNLNDPRIQKQFSSIVGGLKVCGDSEVKQQILPSIENKIGSQCNINQDQINKKSNYSEIVSSLKINSLKIQEMA